jgi:hypothetical protein
LFYNLNPILPGALHLRGGYSYGMVHIYRGLKVLVDLTKIVKAVTYRDQTGNRDLTGFLNNNELFNRVITNEPYMGMSIKILHGFIQRNDTGFSKLVSLIITQVFGTVKEK